MAILFLIYLVFLVNSLPATSTISTSFGTSNKSKIQSEDKKSNNQKSTPSWSTTGNPHILVR
jgi:hypothetical protein